LKEWLCKAREDGLGAGDETKDAGRGRTFDGGSRISTRDLLPRRPWRHRESSPSRVFFP